MREEYHGADPFGATSSVGLLLETTVLFAPANNMQYYNHSRTPQHVHAIHHNMHLLVVLLNCLLLLSTSYTFVALLLSRRLEQGGG